MTTSQARLATGGARSLGSHACEFTGSPRDGALGSHACEFTGSPRDGALGSHACEFTGSPRDGALGPHSPLSQWTRVSRGKRRRATPGGAAAGPGATYPQPLTA